MAAGGAACRGRDAAGPRGPRPHPRDAARGSAWAGGCRSASAPAYHWPIAHASCPPQKPRTRRSGEPHRARPGDMPVIILKL